MQELFLDKIHFFKFLSMSDKPWLDQLKNITAIRGTSFSESFQRYTEGGNTNKEREIIYGKNIYEASATYQAH